MNTAEQAIDKEEILGVAPFNILSPELLDELLASSTIKRLPPGKKAFHAGDEDNEAVFLLSGQLALLSEGGPTTILRAGSDDATKPVEEENPRKSTALASTNVTLLRVDYDVLEQIIEKNKEEKIQANKMSDLPIEQRLEHVLTLPIFKHLPEHNKQHLAEQFTTVTYGEGDVVFHEGSRNDYFYIISEGHAFITRRAPQSGQVIDITELGPDEGFGEESLIANGRHNATVSIKQDCVLFRLPRQEFMTLVIKPTINWLSQSAALTAQSTGAVLLDVRMPSQFIAHNLPGSINLPLPVLRKTASILNNDKEYIVCSDNGVQSIIASFLLNYRGIDVKTMQGPVNPVA